MDIILNYTNKLIRQIQNNNSNSTADGLLLNLLISLTKDIQPLINNNSNNKHNNNSEETICEKINKRVDEFQNIMFHYGLKTVMNKLLKRKKSTTTTVSNTINSISPILKETIIYLNKLLSMIEIIIIREKNNIDSNSLPILLYVGNNNYNNIDQLSIINSKVKIININTIKECVKYLSDNSPQFLLNNTNFRIIIDSDIPILEIKQILLPQIENINKFPINIIVYDSNNNNNNLEENNIKFWSNNYLLFLSNTYNQYTILISTNQIQYQQFITSMVYKSKIKYSSNSNLSSTTTTPILSNKDKIDTYFENNTTGNNNKDDDESTDEDESIHNEQYCSSTSPKFKNVIHSSPTVDLSEQQTITPNRSYTIRNMKPSPKSHNQTPSKTVLVSPSNNNNNNHNSPTSPTISPSSSTNKLDPSLSRINYKTSMFSHSRPIGITTGKVATIHIHLRDALDNPVSTIQTTTNTVNFGPIPTTPLFINLDGPTSESLPFYCFVVGAGIIGISFFPTQHGTYQLDASLLSNNVGSGTFSNNNLTGSSNNIGRYFPIKNSPAVFKSTPDSGLITQSETKSLQKSNNNTNNNSLTNSNEKKRKLPLLDFQSTSNDSIDLIDYIDSIDENKKNKHSLLPQLYYKKEEEEEDTEETDQEKEETETETEQNEDKKEFDLDDLINNTNSNNSSNNNINTPTKITSIINNQLSKDRLIINNNDSLEISPTIQTDEQQQEQSIIKQQEENSSSEFEATLQVA